MSLSEQRQSDRVPYEAPARVAMQAGWADARILDLSRTGVRLRMSLGALGLSGPERLADVAGRLGDLLPRRFRVELNHEALGPLVSHTATLTRIALAGGEEESLEFGCVFDRPLSHEETVMLGVPLGAMRNSEEAWLPRADLPAPFVRRDLPEGDEAETLLDASPAAPDVEAAPAAPAPSPAEVVVPVPAEPAPCEPSPLPDAVPVVGKGARRRRQVRAILFEPVRNDAPHLVCQTVDLTPEGVRLRVPRGNGEEGLPAEGQDVTRAIVVFTRRYGEEVGLRLVDGAEHLWTGPTRLDEAELDPNRPTELLLTMAFARPLRVAERVRLGLD